MKSQDETLGKRADMTWRDHLLMLLSFGAEIEHSLMVQYLYAGYSIGGEGIPKKHEKHRKTVEGWRSSILMVAKEEMGHLLTVQNLLTLLGAPINLNRRDFPYDSDYNPFPPLLVPLSTDSLSCYIYAEMPQLPLPTEPVGKQRPPKYGRDSHDDETIIDEVKKNVEGRFRGRITPHRVGELYRQIIELISDPDRIPDSAFNEATYPIQASWDDWGRGYKPGPRTLDAEGSVMRPPPHEDGQPPFHYGDLKPSERHAHVIVERIATRSQAIKVLRAISGQGEAPHLREDDTGEPSHFERFVQIYEEFKKIEKIAGAGWKPVRNVPFNPTTRDDFVKRKMGDDAGSKPATSASKKPGYTLIEAACARYFADLFNQRYRMLLTYLAHSFQLARVYANDQPSPRGMVMHRVFGEMYNLKAIAGLLVRLPLRDNGKGVYAAPTFEMPYAPTLPQANKEIWRLHLDLLDGAISTCDDLLRDPHCDAKALKACGGEDYVMTLMELDRQAKVWVGGVLAGLA